MPRIAPAPPPPFETVLETLALNAPQKIFLRERYIRLLRSLGSRAVRLSFLFHGARTAVTVGSLIVPALLSIQYTSGTDGSEQSMRIYWITWFISLLVTMCNGLLTLFKVDKRYFFVHTTLEQLISEGWQYAQLTGRYSGFYTPGTRPTHENQYRYFCHAVEKLRMRQVEEEYFKLSELQAHVSGGAPPSAGAGGTPAAGGTAGPPEELAARNHIVSSMIPPTPLKGELERLAPEIQSFLQKQLSLTVTENGEASTAGPRPQENAQSQENREAGALPVP